MKKSNFYSITVGLLLLVFVAVASVSAASITVKAPIGGETWQRGTTHTVTWSYTDFPAGAPVKLILLKADADVGTIVTSTSIGAGGTGSFTWNIGSESTLTTGNNFKVKVQSVNQPTVFGTSPAVFTLTPAGTQTAWISITKPNGGENWQRGTTQTITWDFSKENPGSYVKIALLKGSTEISTIASSVPIGGGNYGSYPWPIASSGTTGSDFKVRVQSISQPTIQDTSDNYFNLLPATAMSSAVVTKSGTAGNTEVVNLPTGFTIDQCGVIVSPMSMSCFSDANPVLANFWTDYYKVPGGTSIKINAYNYCLSTDGKNSVKNSGSANYLIICHS